MTPFANCWLMMSDFNEKRDAIVQLLSGTLKHEIVALRAKCQRFFDVFMKEVSNVRNSLVKQLARKSNFNAATWFACICHACKFADLQLNPIITRIWKCFRQHHAPCLRFGRANAAKLFVATWTAIKSIETNEGPPEGSRLIYRLNFI